MLRVALVLDDYNKLIYLQTILRKIGVDVEGLQNVKKYEELSLGFNPQVLIISAFGKKVNGLEFIKNLHRVRGLPKIIVLTTADRSLTKAEAEQASVDHVLSSPVNPKNLIMAISQMGNVDGQILLDKFEKLQSQGFGIDESTQLVGQEGDRPVMDQTPRFSFREASSSNAESAATSSSSFKLKKDVNSIASLPLEISSAPSPLMAAVGTEREARYNEIISKLEPLQAPKSSGFKRDRIFEMNKKIRAATPPEDIKEIEHDRKEFVRHLFIKK
jgi:response regulator RpfG family c-di-GMP phosphodiesterase